MTAAFASLFPGRAGPRRGLAPGLAAIAAALWLLAATAAEARSYPSIFNSTERISTNLTAFPKWRGTLARYFQESKVSEDCTGSTFNKCHLKGWQRFLDDVQHLDLKRKLDAVNREMNRRRYIIDPINWGVDDYWASPLQFFRKQGDCEDYAISKFMSLRALGVPNEDMRIVVLQDLNLRIGHAILVVYDSDRAYVLDNQSPMVTTADRIRHYKPFYSINETAWWMHRT